MAQNQETSTISRMDRSAEAIKQRLARSRRISAVVSTLTTGVGILAGVDGGHDYNTGTRIGVLGLMVGGTIAINRDRIDAKKAAWRIVRTNNTPPKPETAEPQAVDITPLPRDLSERWANAKTFFLNYLLCNGAANVSASFAPYLAANEKASAIGFGVMSVAGGSLMFANSQDRLRQAEKEFVWRLNPDPEPAQPQLPN